MVARATMRPGKGDVWGGYGGLGMEFRHANVAVFGSAEDLARQQQHRHRQGGNTRRVLKALREQRATIGRRACSTAHNQRVTFVN